MILEIHDNEVDNTLTGRVNDLDYDYMAEQWVQDIIQEEATGKGKDYGRPNPVVKFILKDGLGERAVWEVVENFGVKLVNKSERFQGQWVLESVFR